MRPTRCVPVALMLATLLAVGPPAWAAPGDLDPTFGDGGMTISDDSGDGVESAHDVVVLPNGTLFAVGSIGYETAGPFATYELYSASGQRLTAAGDYPFHGFDASSLRAAAVTPDGKIVVAGWAGSLTDTGALIRSRFLIARFLADGAIDPTFSGDGIAVTPMGWNDADANDVIVRGDGRIVVVGDAARRTDVIAVARYLPGGALDSSFGTNGRAFVAAPNGLREARSAAIDPYGRIVVVARNDVSLPGGGLRARFAVARVRPAGAIDATFGTSGVATIGFGERPAVPTEVVVRPDARIVVGGTVATVNGPRFALARLLPRGAIDLSFDLDGRVLTRFVGGGGTLDGLLRQPDGTLVAGGWDAPGVFALARYLPDGALDPSFGSNGMVRVTALDGSRIEALARQPDGRIVAAGSASGMESVYETPAYARFLP